MLYPDEYMTAIIHHPACTIIRDVMGIDSDIKPACISNENVTTVTY